MAYFFTQTKIVKGKIFVTIIIYNRLGNNGNTSAVPISYIRNIRLQNIKPNLWWML